MEKRKNGRKKRKKRKNVKEWERSKKCEVMGIVRRLVVKGNIYK